MTKLDFKMIVTETDADYLTSHFVKISGMTVHHNVLRDVSTACGIQLICVREKDLKPMGEPRCKRCVRAIDAVLTP